MIFLLLWFVGLARSLPAEHLAGSRPRLHENRRSPCSSARPGPSSRSSPPGSPKILESNRESPGRLPPHHLPRRDQENLHERGRRSHLEQGREDQAQAHSISTIRSTGIQNTARLWPTRGRSTCSAGPAWKRLGPENPRLRLRHDRPPAPPGLAGCQITGVDVDPLCTPFTAPLGPGSVKNPHGRDGHVRLIDGRFPADPAITAAVGGDYDLIISKNTLKKGYVHPEQPVEPRRLLNLGVDDATFVEALHQALETRRAECSSTTSARHPAHQANPTRTGPTDVVLSPREVWETAGFRVLAFDQDDSEPHGQSAMLLDGTRALSDRPQIRPVRQVFAHGKTQEESREALRPVKKPRSRIIGLDSSVAVPR